MLIVKRGWKILCLYSCIIHDDKVQSVKSPKNASCDTHVLNLQNKIKERLVNLSHYVGLVTIIFSGDDD